MAEETLWQSVRGWLGVIVPAGLGFIAVWQDRIRLWITRPKLEVFARTAQPDCDLTHFNTEYPARDAAGHRTGVKSARCYYFRLRVKNAGERLAEKVEVYVERVERRLVDGTFSILENFPPMNLRWAHVGGATRDLGPDMERFCDYGYIVEPEALRECPSSFVLEVHRQAELNDHDSAVFTFDLEVKPNHGEHIVPAGTYRVYLAVGAASVKPIRRCLEMSFSGKWLEPESKMYSDGIRFKFIDVS